MPAPVIQEHRDFFTVDLTTVEAVSEASEGKAKIWKAKVAHVDKVNQNKRLYTKEVIQANIEALKPKMPKGYLCGAVDHIGYFDGGNLADTCIIWRDLSIEPDGAVMGQFEVVQNHSKGRDLMAQLDARMAVGFSTLGYGSSHEPSEMERTKYGLGENDRVSIMDGNYVLKKIDCVDDPSVADARIKDRKNSQFSRENDLDRLNPDDPTGQPNDKRGEDRRLENETMKTLAELKAAHPELFALHEAAIASAVEAAGKALTDKNTALTAAAKTLTDALNGAIEAAKAVEGVKVPTRDVMPAEHAKQISDFRADIAKLAKAERDAEAAKVAAENEAAALKAEKAEASRKEASKARLGEVLKQEAYKALAPAIEKAAEKSMADKTFTADTVEAFVKAKAEEYATLKLAPQEPGLKGRTEGEDKGDDAASEDADALGAAAESVGALATLMSRKK